MFQSFEATSRPEQGPPRLAALRGEMARAALDGFLVPRADAHQGEYVAPCDDRLAWLTGFTGSAGFCAVLADVAGVFIDGRYRVQVRDQTAGAFTPVHWPETQLAPWLKAQLTGGGIVGFDPWLHTVSEIRKLRGALEGSQITLRPVGNLVDAIWPDRPARPQQPIRPYPEELAGLTTGQKREALRTELETAHKAGAVLTLPDSICWLLNIRGGDIPRNPIVHAFAVANASGVVDLFTDAAVDAEIRGYFADNQIALHPYGGLIAHLTGTQSKYMLDPSSAPEALRLALEERGDAWAGALEGADPCVLPKARKTDAEIAATREAHLRDAAAMCAFLAWLDTEAPKGALTEIDVVQKLEGLRRDTGALLDISFDTICGSGPHGAIVHYRVTEGTNRAVSPGELLLVDSGGQYLDGTTDITRTIAVGEAGEEERRCFTRVLQGMIAVSQARWPKGLAGRDLDALARVNLWRAGLDYDHGTGHGVGVYLCVHEGPARISRVSGVPLEPGMILSNEPGYYREGAFGIRIENLVVVQPAAVPPGGDAREMLDFETLTWVPIDRALIAPELLTPDERAWINAYHAKIVDKVAARLSGAARAWLERATAPI